jgi:hypothetical protein
MIRRFSVFNSLERGIAEGPSGMDHETYPYESVVAACRRKRTEMTQRLSHFAQRVTEDRTLQVAVAIAVSSLWLTLALDDVRFLVLLLAGGVAIHRFQQLERDVVPDDDELF